MGKTKVSKKKEQKSSNELLENPDALVERYNKAEEFLSDPKNRNIVLGVGSFIAIIIAGFIFYKYYMNNRNQAAQAEIFPAIYYFEADSLGKALNGDGNNFGFLDIIDEYGNTEAGNLANYYTGATYLKLGDYENAIRYLEDFSASDYLVQARAYSLIGDAYMELEAFEEAASNYMKAADYKENKYFTPLYLSKAATAYESAGNIEEAIDAYTEIVDNYFDSDQYTDARKQMSRLEIMIN
ncbi:MAG TPA: tol-pal system YbgF family protein [Cyclobacteriaceae bacterium]